MRRVGFLRSASAPLLKASGTSASAVAVDALPPASEAPHLLEAGKGAKVAKPFVRARDIKLFTTYFAIGAACAGTVYVVLSKAIAQQYLGEQALVDDISATLVPKTSQQETASQIAKHAQQAVIGEFVPRSYLQLHEASCSASSTGDSFSSTDGAATRQVPMLHDEINFRFRTFWNTLITNVQVSLETFAVQYKVRRERNALEHIHQLVEESGLDVSSLRRVD